VSARMLNYYDWNNEILICPNCGWSDVAEKGKIEYFQDLFDIRCPRCPFRVQRHLCPVREAITFSPQAT
jgi:hypothetical protein